MKCAEGSWGGGTHTKGNSRKTLHALLAAEEKLGTHTDLENVEASRVAESTALKLPCLV